MSGSSRLPDFPDLYHQPVKGLSLGRLDSIVRRIGWILGFSAPCFVFIFIILAVGKNSFEILRIIAYVLFLFASGIGLFGFFWIFSVRAWPLSKRELNRGYTTLYSRLVREVDIIDWKTGAVIVTAGSEPPTRGEFNARIRAARRARR